MELWIAITIFAAFMQNLRSSLQKYLKGRLSTSGATFSRFAFAMPLALLYITGLVTIGDQAMPQPTGRFAAFAAVGGAAQILATALLVYLFSFRNFAVGTTFSKTEAAQTAVFGIVVLGEAVSIGAAIGIAISLVGVVMISLTRVSLNVHEIVRQCLQRPALIGLASGAMFGISAVSVRAASLSLGSGNFLTRAALTLAVVTAIQTLTMAVYMRIREPGQVSAVLRSWRISCVVGLTGMLGSAAWFTAMTLQNAAYVRVVGQVELLFTFAVSYFFFRERISPSELMGIMLVTAGVIVLVLVR